MVIFENIYKIRSVFCRTNWSIKLCKQVFFNFFEHIFYEILNLKWKRNTDCKLIFSSAIMNVRYVHKLSPNKTHYTPSYIITHLSPPLLIFAINYPDISNWWRHSMCSTAVQPQPTIHKHFPIHFQNTYHMNTTAISFHFRHSFIHAPKSKPNLSTPITTIFSVFSF